MIIKEQLVPKSKWNLKCPNTMTPEYIVIHNTGGDASAAQEANYMITNNSSTSFHYVVDDTEAI